MIKLQDFARECAVTDRQIQRLLKKYEEELAGHFERKGPNGTWLDEEACEILRGKMKHLPSAVVDGEVARKNEDLERENKDLLKALNMAKDRIIELQGAQARLEAAEATQRLLEESREEYKAEAARNAQKASEEAQRAKELQRDYEQAAEALEKMREEATQRLQEAELAEEREQQALQAAQELQSRLEASEAREKALKERSWWERLMRKGE